MVALPNTTVRRGGITAEYLNVEPTRCDAWVNASEKEVRIQTSIASKGGGTTVVSIAIPIKDFRELLKEVARTLPHDERIFLDAALTASKEQERHRNLAGSSLREIADRIDTLSDSIAQSVPLTSLVSYTERVALEGEARGVARGIRSTIRSL